MAGVVGMAGEDRAGAVELFGEDEAGDGVGESEGTEGEDGFRAQESVGGPAVGGTDGEGDVLNAVLAMSAKPGGEELRGHDASVAIEQDGEDGGAAAMAVEPGEEGLFCFECFGFGAEEDGAAFEVTGSEDLEGVVCGKAGAHMGERYIHAEEDTAGSIGKRSRV